MLETANVHPIFQQNYTPSELLAGIDASVLTCGNGFDQPDIPIAG
jgi:hypothetical protein